MNNTVGLRGLQVFHPADTTGNGAGINTGGFLDMFTLEIVSEKCFISAQNNRHCIHI